MVKRYTCDEENRTAIIFTLNWRRSFWGENKYRLYMQRLGYTRNVKKKKAKTNKQQQKINKQNKGKGDVLILFF